MMFIPRNYHRDVGVPSWLPDGMQLDTDLQEREENIERLKEQGEYRSLQLLMRITMARRNYMGGKGRGLPKEQCQTPIGVPRYFKRELRAHRNEFIDTCVLNENWARGFSFDALLELFREGISWCNCPFT